MSALQGTSVLSDYCTPLAWVTALQHLHFVLLHWWQFHIVSACMAIGHSQLLAWWPSVLWQISCMAFQSTWQPFSRLLKTHFFSNYLQFCHLVIVSFSFMNCSVCYRLVNSHLATQTWFIIGTWVESLVPSAKVALILNEKSTFFCGGWF